jgi:hypothetical protein
MPAILILLIPKVTDAGGAEAASFRVTPAFGKDFGLGLEPFSAFQKKPVWYFSFLSFSALSSPPH